VSVLCSCKPNKKLILKLPVFSLSPELLTSTRLFGISIVSRRARRKIKRIEPLKAHTGPTCSSSEEQENFCCTERKRRAAAGGPSPSCRTNGVNPAGSNSQV